MMRTRVKIFSSHAADTVANNLNQFLGNNDETIEVVAIHTHTASVGLGAGRDALYITVTLLYREIAD